jgi:hypothetical protein
MAVTALPSVMPSSSTAFDRDRCNDRVPLASARRWRWLPTVDAGDTGSDLVACADSHGTQMLGDRHDHNRMGVNTRPPLTHPSAG